MDSDEMQTLNMQMQRPGPIGAQNVMVAHEVGEKVADGDLLLVPADSGYYVDPADADDALQSIKPKTTVKFSTLFDSTLFGITYVANQQHFRHEDLDSKVTNTPTCTVAGTNAVVNLSGDVIHAFEKLMPGPAKDPPPSWRQASSATVTLRRVSPIVWRTDVSHLDAYAVSPDLYDLFRREYRETCPFTVIPVMIVETARLRRTIPNWDMTDLGREALWYHLPADTPDGKAQRDELAVLDPELTAAWNGGANRTDSQKRVVDVFLDKYYDCLRNQEMLSLGRCPVHHHCETLMRF